MPGPTPTSFRPKWAVEATEQELKEFDELEQAMFNSCASPPISALDPADRCAEFVEAMIDLCRQHRVLLEYDDEEDEFAFMEEPDETGHAFMLGVSDVEESVRLALWDEFNGIGEEEE